MAGPAFLFLGEAVWLDLANTAPNPVDSVDALPDADASRAWLAAAGLPILDPRLDPSLLTALRGESVRLAQALAEGRRPPTAAIAAINGVLRGAPGRELLTRTAGAWRLRFLPTTPPGPLELLARSAARTLADATGQVRRCADASCQRFFVDATSHHTQAWCREICHASAAIDRRRTHRPQSTT